MRLGWKSIPCRFSHISGLFFVSFARKFEFEFWGILPLGTVGADMAKHRLYRHSKILSLLQDFYQGIEAWH